MNTESVRVLTLLRMANVPEQLYSTIVGHLQNLENEIERGHRAAETPRPGPRAAVSPELVKERGDALRSATARTKEDAAAEIDRWTARVKLLELRLRRVGAIAEGRRE